MSAKEQTIERLRRYRRDIVAFTEDQFIVPETRRLIKLEDWQKELILKPLFYDVDENGKRKYDIALIGVPKKNGKSTLAAVIGVYTLYCGDPMGEIIVAANDKDQASMIIYSKIRAAVNLNPVLKQGVTPLKTMIEVKSTGTTCRCIAHQYESAAGLNPNLTLFDELWGFSDRKFYDELTLTPARENPLVVIVTYAGYVKDGLLWDLYQDGMLGDTLLEVPGKEIYIKRGRGDKSMFFFWSHENLASWVTSDYLEKQKHRMPANVYARFHENRWAPATAGFLTRQDIARCLDEAWTMQLAPVREKGFRYIVAIDLGLTRDRTARAVVHFDPSDQRVYLDNLRVWEGSAQEPVSIFEVEQDLLHVIERFGCNLLVVDPWQMQATMQKLKGLVNVKSFNFASDMTRLSETMLSLVRNRKVCLYQDNRLLDELESIYAKQTARGWRIDHVSGQKNDCVIALGMAACEAIQQALSLPGVWF